MKDRLVSTAIYLAASAIGFGAFISPFFYLGDAQIGSLSPDRTGESPLVLSLLLAICLAALLYEAQGQAVDTKLVSLLGILVAINSALRFIEVKGRSHIGEVVLSTNEFKTAQRLRKDYWLYVVFNCATEPEVHVIQDPARLGWEPIVKVDHYHVSAQEVLAAGGRGG